MCSWTNLAILAATAIPAANGFQGSGHYYASKTSQLLGRTYSGRIAFANSDGEHSIRQRRTQLHLFGNFFNRDKNSDDAEAEIKKEGGDRKLKVPFFAEVKTEKVAVVDEVNLVSAEEDFGGDVQTLVKEEPEKPKPKPKLSPREQAELLKQQAARIRLEAERMDVALTLEKIGSLEKSLGLTKNVNETARVQEQINVLTQKLNPPAPKPASAPASTSSSKSSASSTASAEEFEFEPLTETQLEEKIKELKEMPKFLRDVTAKGADFDNSNDLRALAQKLHEDQWFYDVLEKRSKMEEYVPLTSMEIKKRISLYEKLPPFIRDMNEKQAGTTNITEIVIQTYKDELDLKRADIKLDKVIQDIKDGKNVDQQQVVDSSPSLAKLFPGLDKNANEKEKDDDSGSGSWLFGGGEKKSREDVYVENLLPKPTRKEGQAPSEADVNVFIEEVLSINTFSVPTKKAVPVPGGYVVRGSARMENIDEMIAAIDADLARSPVAEKLQFFYMNDPTPISEDQIMMGSRDPVLYLCGNDLSPSANPFLTSAVSIIGLFFLASFSTAFFFFNDSIMEHFNADQAAGYPDGTGWVTNLIQPFFYSMLGIQLSHELGHKIVALANGFDTALPILVPSPQLGTLGSVTSLTSSPKNRNALFDFAIAGPLFGIIASLVVMYLGLEYTAYADDASYANFPAVPLYFLKQSALGGGLIDNVLGSTLLSVPDLNKLIPVHPFVIAGLSSLLVNALTLAPFGGTDGGRIILASFGRSGALFTKLVVLATLVVVSLFSNQPLVLTLVPFLVFFQGQLEIPLRNEIDGIDATRGAIAIATSILALLALIPDV